MNFGQKLRILFFGDKALHDVIRTLPAPDWVEKMQLRTTGAEEKPALTIAELHAALSEAVAAGKGHKPIAIELAHEEGLLCGCPSVLVSRVSVEGPHSGLWGSPHLVLETSRSVMMLDRGTFETAMKLDALQGPYT